MGAELFVDIKVATLLEEVYVVFGYRAAVIYDRGG
jgi:hypothetical protein